MFANGWKMKNLQKWTEGSDRKKEAKKQCKSKRKKRESERGKEGGREQVNEWAQQTRAFDWKVDVCFDDYYLFLVENQSEFIHIKRLIPLHINSILKFEQVTFNCNMFYSVVEDTISIHRYLPLTMYMRMSLIITIAVWWSDQVELTVSRKLPWRDCSTVTRTWQPKNGKHRGAMCHT